MVYSNKRKLCLSGWLQKYNNEEYNSPLKLQKFLVLYEAFSKVEGETPDFSHLRGYKRGPVFSNVWGDYTKDRTAFNAVSMSCYEEEHESVNVKRARKCAFIVSTLSEAELSDLTHELNLWKVKEERIMSGEYQVRLMEADFNSEDAQLVSCLEKMYPDEIVDNSEVIRLERNYFIFRKADVQKLTEQHLDTLMTLAENENLSNPVYVDIDEKGRLVID